MPQSAGVSRKVTKLSKSLHQELAVYAFAAGAAGVGVLALAQPSEAEVIYTKADQRINRHQGFAIDLNHDGITDFTIQNLSRRQKVRGYFYSSDILLQVVPADGVQGGVSFTSLAAALPPGAKIGPIQPVGHNRSRGAIMASQFRQGSFGTYYWGSWLNVSNRYLGLAFNIGGEVHFGWARLTVHWNHRWTLSADLTGYAYETEANKPIIAGDTGNADAEDANSDRTGEILPASQPEVRPTATLGALALGAGSLSIWRREE